MNDPVIRTARLALVPWAMDDAEELRALLDANDAHLRPWIPFMKSEPRDLDGTRSVIEDCIASFAAGEHLRYGIRTREGSELVGEAMLIDRGEPGMKELGYWLAASATGKGYATEAGEALLAAAFGPLGLARVEMVCDVLNGASVAVAKRLGGHPEREIDEAQDDGTTCRLGVHVVRGDQHPD